MLKGYRTLLSIDRGEWVLLPHCGILNIDRGNTKPEKLGCWTGKNHMTNQFIILDWIVEEDKFRAFERIFACVSKILVLTADVHTEAVQAALARHKEQKMAVPMPSKRRSLVV
ncbi:uncharacterized protein [Macaca nemestrina]|uniref:uncharacterized protein isoform X5 n=1 Tax=Macaca nemestrina TaxID=9545 RepID=UPI0039B894A9